MTIYELFDESIDKILGFYSTLEKAKQALIDEITNNRALNADESRIFKLKYTIEERIVK